MNCRASWSKTCHRVLPGSNSENCPQAILQNQRGRPAGSRCMGPARAGSRILLTIRARPTILLKASVNSSPAEPGRLLLQVHKEMLISPTMLRADHSRSVVEFDMRDTVRE